VRSSVDLVDAERKFVNAELALKLSFSYNLKKELLENLLVYVMIDLMTIRIHFKF